MPQIADIELAGQPCMLAPGSYRRMADGLPEGRSGRIVISDFVGGQRRALQLERDTSWDSAGVGPALFGQGVEPWPWNGTHVDAALIPVSSAQRVHALPLGDRVYIGAGRYVYRTVQTTATTWADLAQVADLGAGQVVTGLAYYQGRLAIAAGNGLDIRLLDVNTLALSALLAGFRGSWIAGYANRLIAADPSPGNEGVLTMTTGGGPDTRELDAPIVNMTLHAGRVAIATRSGIWLLGGRSDPATGKWLGEPEPLFSHGTCSESEDYVFLASYGGKLYTWLAGQVMEWNPNAGASKQGWRAAGLEGRACYGGTVAGNMLVVSIQNRAGTYELWAFDGTGWWLKRSVSTAARIWPAYVAGAGATDLIAFRNGDASVAYDRYRMVYRDAALHAYASTGAFTTSLLDAGERDADKAWRAIGATFAAPETRGNAASTDPLSVSLAYSLDGGAAWTTAAVANLASPAQRTLALRADLPSGAAVSRYLQLRVTWTSVADWAPVLTGVWAEYAVLDTPARRRRWAMTVIARDGLVLRDGSVATTSGRQQIADLWAAWDGNQTIALRDLDYDDDPVDRQVRIVDIEEITAKPADASQWGEASVRLTLVEV
jgi:hypothetical protein